MVSPTPAVPLAAVPRTTGEVITDAVDALRRSFGVVFALGVPFCAVDLVLREFGQSVLGQMTAKLGAANGDPAMVLAEMLPLLAALGAGFASFIVQTLLSAAVVAVGESVAAGQQPSVSSALRKLVDRGAAVVFTALLFMLLAFGVPFVVAVVPLVISTFVAMAVDQPALVVVGGGVGFLLSLVVFIVLTLRWSLYSVVAVTEPRSFFAALRRSSELTAPRGLPFAETPRFRLSVLFLVGLALAGVLQSLFVGPRIAIAFATGWSLADGAMPGLASLPVWFMVPFGLAEVVTNAAVLPFSALLLYFFTLDLRVRYEGADVVDAAASPATAR
jgi:hypothetical protein